MLDNKSIKSMIEYIGEDYSSILVDYIKKEYSLTDIDNSNLHFLIEKDNAIKNNIKNYLLDNKKQRMTKSFILIGVLYAFIGIFAYLLVYNKDKIFDIDNLFLLISMIGMFVSIFGLIILLFLKTFTKYSAKNISINQHFIKLHDILESILMNKSTENYIVNNRVSGKGLNSIKELSKKDILEIKQIRSLRNIMVHKTKGIINDKKVQLKIQSCDDLINKLK